MHMCPTKICLTKKKCKVGTLSIIESQHPHQVQWLMESIKHTQIANTLVSKESDCVNQCVRVIIRRVTTPTPPYHCTQ